MAIVNRKFQGDVFYPGGGEVAAGYVNVRVTGAVPADLSDGLMTNRPVRFTVTDGAIVNVDPDSPANYLTANVLYQFEILDAGGYGGSFRFEALVAAEDSDGNSLASTPVTLQELYLSQATVESGVAAPVRVGDSLLVLNSGGETDTTLVLKPDGDGGIAWGTGGGSGSGSTWRDGSGAPSNGLGSNGDYYLNDSNGDVYHKASGTYSIVANIKGATGSTGATGATGSTGAAGSNGTNGTNGSNGAPGAVWRNGSGAPSNGTGIDGDFYLNTANGDVYKRASGTYSVVTNITGPAGATGSAPTDVVLTDPSASSTNTITSTANSAVPLTLKKKSGQTAAMLKITDESNVAYVTVDDSFGTKAVVTTNSWLSVGNMAIGQSARVYDEGINGFIAVRPDQILISPSSSVGIGYYATFQFSKPMLDVHNNSTTRVTLSTQNIASQTANSIEVNDSTPTLLWAVDCKGGMHPVHMADAAAQNDSVYYSTDAGKLVYKDSGGTVNNLY